MYDHHNPSHHNNHHNKQYLTTNSNNPYGKYQYQARQASTRHTYDLPSFLPPLPLCRPIHPLTHFTHQPTRQIETKWNPPDGRNTLHCKQVGKQASIAVPVRSSGGSSRREFLKPNPLFFLFSLIGWWGLHPLTFSYWEWMQTGNWNSTWLVRDLISRCCYCYCGLLGEWLWARRVAATAPRSLLVSFVYPDGIQKWAIQILLLPT